MIYGFYDKITEKNDVESDEYDLKKEGYKTKIQQKKNDLLLWYFVDETYGKPG